MNSHMVGAVYFGLNRSFPLENSTRSPGDIPRLQATRFVDEMENIDGLKRTILPL